MISREREDRFGVPRWRHSTRTAFDTQKIYHAVANNLIAASFNRRDEPASQRCLGTQLAPLVAELLWLRDRTEMLEKHVSALRGHVARELKKEE